MNRKAIVVYVDNNAVNLEEFSWLYKTWILWSLHKEYDIVAYINPKAIEILYSYVEDHVNLIIRPLTPIYETDPFWENYKFANSFFMFNDESEKDYILERYSYILKTDCDVFLTQHLLGLEPERVMIGMGGYMNNFDEIKSNLKRISNKLNAKDRGFNHIGASIFGDSSIVVNIVRNHFSVTKYILSTEWANGPGAWPGWTRGVSSMYAIHIVVNHILNKNIVNLYSLDTICFNNKIDTNTYHVHAWHSTTDFSKHKWFKGGYIDVKKEFDEIPKIAKDYCLCVASNTIEDLLKMNYTLAKD